MIDIKKHIIKNRNGCVLETPEGWVLYWRFDDSIWIDDLEVYETNNQVALRLASAVERIAREEGRHFMYTNLHPMIKGTDRMEQLIMKFGFELYSESDLINIYIKELKPESAKPKGNKHG